MYLLEFKINKFLFCTWNANGLLQAGCQLYLYLAPYVHEAMNWVLVEKGFLEFFIDGICRSVKGAILELPRWYDLNSIFRLKNSLLNISFLDIFLGPQKERKYRFHYYIIFKFHSKHMIWTLVSSHNWWDVSWSWYDVLCLRRVLRAGKLILVVTYFTANCFCCFLTSSKFS